MKRSQKWMSLGWVLVAGLLFAACAELNPKFETSLNNAIKAQKGEFQTCYEKALERNRNVKGEMDLKLEFKANSKQASKASVSRSQIKDNAMKKCVSNAAKRMETTELPGAWVEGKYTLDFTHN